MIIIYSVAVIFVVSCCVLYQKTFLNQIMMNDYFPLIKGKMITF